MFGLVLRREGKEVMDDSEYFVVSHLIGGITYEYSEAHPLHVFKIENGQQSTLDSWVTYVQQLFERWKGVSPLLMMHDFSRLHWWELGEQFDDCTNQLFASHSTLKRFVALVTPEENYTQILRLEYRMRELLMSRGYPVHWDVFYHRKAALAWLHSNLGMGSETL